jgi:hypothetical protein
MSGDPEHYSFENLCDLSRWHFIVLPLHPFLSAVIFFLPAGETGLGRGVPYPEIVIIRHCEYPLVIEDEGVSFFITHFFLYRFIKLASCAGYTIFLSFHSSLCPTRVLSCDMRHR